LISRILLTGFLFLLSNASVANQKGKCIAGNCKNGSGTFKFRDSSQFEGYFVDGQRSGKGTLKNKDWEMTATWLRNEPFGDVSLIFTRGKHKGRTYFGEYRMGLGYNGFGTLSMKDGGFVEGYFLNGKLNGLAIQTSKSGEIVRSGSYRNGRLVRPQKVEFNKEQTGSSRDQLIRSGLEILNSCEQTLNDWHGSETSSFALKDQDEATDLTVEERLKNLTKKIQSLRDSISVKKLSEERREYANQAASESDKPIETYSRAIKDKQTEQDLLILETNASIKKLEEDKKLLSGYNAESYIATNNGDKKAAAQKNDRGETICSEFLKQRREEPSKVLTTSNKTCVPSSVKAQQLAMIIVSEFKRRPADLHLPAIDLFHRAVRNSFNCP
jgi:hypothetical protein